MLSHIKNVKCHILVLWSNLFCCLGQGLWSQQSVGQCCVKNYKNNVGHHQRHNSEVLCMTGRGIKRAARLRIAFWFSWLGQLNQSECLATNPRQGAKDAAPLLTPLDFIWWKWYVPHCGKRCKDEPWFKTKEPNKCQSNVSLISIDLFAQSLYFKYQWLVLAVCVTQKMELNFQWFLKIFSSCCCPDHRTGVSA